jgi:hypothetical protein
MRKIRLPALLASLALLAGASACTLGNAAEPELVVYQTPTCGCCGDWAEYMGENGFQVRIVTQADLMPIRREHGVPAVATSCHVAIVQGFAVEGHVPADAVHRLLRERPDVAGIAVPGMPAGSPGMERADGYREAYGIYTFDRSGNLAAYGFRN